VKIAFVGGGSVLWNPILTTDMALTDELAGAELVLHDIDLDALELMTRTSKRIVEQVGGQLEVTATADRVEALRDADFVIVSVAIGGLEAMRNDLEIPERYGVYQSVGDTVGPGGLARALRNIPFIVKVAREMETLCPDAWLLNVTNPMTTLCRAVTRTTSVRIIGLCHEATGVCHHLAKLLAVPTDAITLDVLGINHLPVISQFNIDGNDGMPLLRDWLVSHDPFAFVEEHDPDPGRDIFADRLAVKLTLLEQLGVLFGAGDRHVAEFFPGFLTAASEWGKRYGVGLTTIKHREDGARERRARIERFVAGEPGELPESGNLRKSEEQMAPVMAALSGGPSGRFIVNIPNVGQIDNLPRDAVVECVAQVDDFGVRPLAAGALPYAASAVIAPHVVRQELIVEAALTGRREPALAALATDPLVRDSGTVVPMLDELLSANEAYVKD